MRLLMVSTIGKTKDGLYVRPYNIAKYLGSCEVDFSLIVFSKKLNGLSQAQVTILPEEYYATFKRIPSIALLSSALADMIGKWRPDIIYAHQLPNILCAWLGTLKAGVAPPIVGDLHGLPSLEMAAWGNPIEAGVDHVLESLLTTICRGLIVASEEIRQELLHRGLQSSKIHVVPNCIDPKEFQPLNRKNELRKLLNLPLDKTIVAFTAPRSFTPNLMAVKHLYGVASLLEKRSPEILFVIIGDGEVIEGKPSNVTYAGYVEDLNSYLNACDLAVAPYPSLAICGGARNKLLEYWACGLPVVSTAEGVRGLGFPYEKLPVVLTGYDQENLAYSVQQAANNPSQMRGLTERAKALVIAEFNWKSQALIVHRILQSYASGQSASNPEER